MHCRCHFAQSIGRIGPSLSCILFQKVYAVDGARETTSRCKQSLASSMLITPRCRKSCTKHQSRMVQHIQHPKIVKVSKQMVRDGSGLLGRFTGSLANRLKPRAKSFNRCLHSHTTPQVGQEYLTCSEQTSRTSLQNEDIHAENFGFLTRIGTLLTYSEGNQREQIL